MIEIYNSPEPTGQCPSGLHDTVPIIEEGRTIGIVCLICGHQVYENRVPSGMIVGTDGTIHRTKQAHRPRKDPRF